jgi:hypothetical protein
MAGKKPKGAGYGAVRFLEHAGKRLLGNEILGAVRKRVVHHITPKPAAPASFKRGGRVKKTGKAKLHKGEIVLPVKTVKTLKRLMK